jgi:hypothetical protein
MPATYEPISTQTLASAVATVTFSSIPATYTDLVLIMTGIASTVGTDSCELQFNGDTATNYSYTLLTGNGAAASSGRGTGAAFIAVGLITSSEQVSNIWNIMNYANTTTFKSVLGHGNIAGAQVRTGVGTWRSTSAITSILLKNDTAQNFAIGSTFTLYGIKAA